MGKRPIAQKYCEGKVKSTLGRGWKEPENICYLSVFSWKLKFNCTLKCLWLSFKPTLMFYLEINKALGTRLFVYAYQGGNSSIFVYMFLVKLNMYLDLLLLLNCE
jgi:hypothetical protein